jgi:hypothetical protein
MLRTAMVVWLALLVLALNVVAFVTRLAEKRRLASRSQNPPKEQFLSNGTANWRF